MSKLWAVPVTLSLQGLKPAFFDFLSVPAGEHRVRPDGSPYMNKLY